MVRYKLILAASLVLVTALVTSQVEAEVYRFWGSLSDGTVYDFAPTNDLSDVSVNDNWEIRLDVNTGREGEPILDTDDNPTGVYDYNWAVSTAEIKFWNDSGGEENPTYSETFDFTGDAINSILVTNKLFAGSTYISQYDEVGFTGEQDETGQPYTLLEVFVGTETDASAITDEKALPLAGTAFSQDFLDEFGVLYFVSPGGDILDFEASTGQDFEVVPEPSSILIWCLAAGLGAVVWRRRRAA